MKPNYNNQLLYSHYSSVQGRLPMIIAARKSRTRNRAHQLAWVFAIVLLVSGHAWAQSGGESLATSGTAPETGNALEFDPNRLVARIDATLKEMLYSDAAYQHPRTQMMLLELRQAAGQGADAEQLVEIARSHQDRLPFSHFWIRPPREGEASPGPEPVIALSEPEDGLFMLRIDSFNDLQADWVAESFQTIVDNDARGLIIDLRNNRGGTYSSGFIAAHLFDQTSSSGTLFARPVRQPILAGGVDAFPSVAVQDIESVDHLGRLIREHGAFTLTVRPSEPHYAGPAIVLTSHATASASEPLVYSLQRSGRVMLIGEPTAGEMLSADTVDIGQGWRMFAPVLDYITGDGQRLDLRGVAPDVPVPAGQALEAAMQSLNQDEPTE